MDDSKLRLRRHVQHAGAGASLSCVEEGGGGGGTGGGSNSHLNINLLGSPTGASSSSSSSSVYNNSKIRRIKRHQISRRKIITKACKLCLGGLAAAIVSATLSLTLLPKKWSKQVTQVDYHHQLQNEVIFLYQKLEDNRKNYHSVVDNYHPNGMSYMHKHHHHIQDNQDNAEEIEIEKDINHNEEEEATTINNNNNNNEKDNGVVAVGPVDKHKDSKDENNKDVFVKLKKKKKRNLRHPPSSSFDYVQQLPEIEIEDVDVDSSSRENKIKSNDNNTNKQQQKQQQQPAQPQIKSIQNQNIKRPEIVTCGDGVTVGFLNDDYCDCPYDGIDEPDTSACSNVLIQKNKFSCGQNTGNNKNIKVGNNGGGGDMSKLKTNTKWIYSSRVNDGIIDCPDGSDEYGYIIAEQQQQHQYHEQQI
jgi:hypothetical protein